MLATIAAIVAVIAVIIVVVGIGYLALIFTAGDPDAW